MKEKKGLIVVVDFVVAVVVVNEITVMICQTRYSLNINEYYLIFSKHISNMLIFFLHLSISC